MQRAVPGCRINGRGSQSGQSPAKALPQRARAEQGRARRGKLQSQREPIQVHRQFGRAAQRLLALSPARARRLGAFHQENRGIAAHPAAVPAPHRQRIQHEPVLSCDASSHPAGHHQGESRTVIQQPHQQRRGARQKVLQVVQHQKHPPRPQARQQRLARVPPRFLADSQGVRERGWQGGHLGQAGQRHPGHAIGVQPVSFRLDPRDIHHQTGFPDSARAQHRNQANPGLGQQRPDTADLDLPPDQGAVRCRHRDSRRQPRRRGPGPGQYVLVRALHLLTRVGAQLVPEYRADLLVGGQRVRLTAHAIQRGDQLRPQQLPQRIPGHPRLELRNQLLLPPAGQPGASPRLHRRQPQLGQPGSLRLGERRSYISQRLSPPQPQRPAQRIHHHSGVIGRAQARAQCVLHSGQLTTGGKTEYGRFK